MKILCETFVYEESYKNMNRPSPLDLILGPIVVFVFVYSIAKFIYLIADYFGGAPLSPREQEQRICARPYFGDIVFESADLSDPLGHVNPVVVNTTTECWDIVQKLKLKCEKFRVLGFDCEWVDIYGPNRVALLQLAAEDGFCALIRMFRLRDIPRNLRELLEDSSILKVGTEPMGDAQLLLNDYNLKVRGCLDLRHLAVKRGPLPKGGHAGLAKKFLDVELDKSRDVRCSNWEASQLSVRQVDYAARDALVSVELFKKLADKHWKLEELQPYVDVRYKHQQPLEYRSFSPESSRMSLERQPVFRTLSKPVHADQPFRRRDVKVFGSQIHQGPRFVPSLKSRSQVPVPDEEEKLDMISSELSKCLKLVEELERVVFANRGHYTSSAGRRWEGPSNCISHGGSSTSRRYVPD